jgi:hypothetical protein
LDWGSFIKIHTHIFARSALEQAENFTREPTVVAEWLEEAFRGL